MSKKQSPNQHWRPVEKNGQRVGFMPVNRAARRAAKAMERKGSMKRIGTVKKAEELAQKLSPPTRPKRKVGAPIPAKPSDPDKSA